MSAAWRGSLGRPSVERRLHAHRGRAGPRDPRGILKGAVSGHAGPTSGKPAQTPAGDDFASVSATGSLTPASSIRSTPLVFAFADTRPDREQALFVQDRAATGRWTVDAGLRWDHYSLLVDESAVEPARWASRGPGLPPASCCARPTIAPSRRPPSRTCCSPARRRSTPRATTVCGLPVRPSRGRLLRGRLLEADWPARLRLDVTHFRRTMNNFADDDLLLNTGVSFPIAFRRAVIQGTELKLDVPRWRTLSGSTATPICAAQASLPLRGGCFSATRLPPLLTSRASFPVSQDQRHTVRGRVSYQAHLVHMGRGWDVLRQWTAGRIRRRPRASVCAVPAIGSSIASIFQADASAPRSRSTPRQA